jgi:elongation factor Ts
MTTTITAKDVQELRQRTGAGMMDCKKALEETKGNVEEAIDYLRKKGIAKAEKRAGRSASEGRIVSVVSPDGHTGALVEVNCETDFVSRNEGFGALAQAIAEQVLADDTIDGVTRDATDAPLLARPWNADSTLSVADAIKEASAKNGELVVLRRYARFKTSGTVASYVHHNGKVGVLVEVDGGKGDLVAQVGKSVAEHAAAGVPTVPVAVDRDEVSQELVDRERRIFEEQAKASGKPDAIIEKMVGGRIDKYYKEVTLLEQPWVRDDSKTIREIVSDAAKQAGATLVVRRFARFQMGEE